MKDGRWTFHPFYTMVVPQSTEKDTKNLVNLKNIVNNVNVDEDKQLLMLLEGKTELQAKGILEKSGKVFIIRKVESDLVSWQFGDGYDPDRVICYIKKDDDIVYRACYA